MTEWSETNSVLGAEVRKIALEEMAPIWRTLFAKGVWTLRNPGPCPTVEVAFDPDNEDAILASESERGRYHLQEAASKALKGRPNISIARLPKEPMEQNPLADVVERVKKNGWQVPRRPRGLNYEERETLKIEAHAVLGSNEPLPGRADALLRLIEAHYWRAREALEALPNSTQKKIHGKRWIPGYELDIDVYTRHWLWANGDRDQWAEEARYLEDKFGYYPERSPYLPKGMSMYREKNH